MIGYQVAARGAADPENQSWRWGETYVAIPVDVKDVERVLNPWLGTMLLSSSPIAAEIAHEVMEYAPYRQTFQELKETIDHDLFAGVSRATGGSMCVVLDDYSTRRLKLKDMEWMADDVMGLAFDCLTPFSANFTKLNDYALHAESLAALRVLYQKYRDFFTEEQYVFIIQMIRKIYPKERYAAWLKEANLPPATLKD